MCVVDARRGLPGYGERSLALWILHRAGHRPCLAGHRLAGSAPCSSGSAGTAAASNAVNPKQAALNNLMQYAIEAGI